MPRPATAVVRVSRGDFDSGRFAEVQAMTEETGSYLVPAISKLADHLSRGRLAQGARRADEPAEANDPRRPRRRGEGRRQLHPDRQLPGQLDDLKRLT